LAIDGWTMRLGLNLRGDLAKLDDGELGLRF
jgi:hypothetical protein